MKKIKNNTSGFTLVELLAVIVVLAIVMLMAVMAIMPRLQEARVNVFALESNNVVEAANTYLVNNALQGNGVTLPTGSNDVCITLKELVDSGNLKIKAKASTSDTEGAYAGGVRVVKDATNNNYKFYVWLHKDKLMINGIDGSVQITNDKVGDYTTASAFGGGKTFAEDSAGKGGCTNFPSVS